MKRIVINFLYSACYQILLIALPLVTTPYLSRIFEPSVLGEYSYCFTVASIFSLFGILGINNYGNRLIAEHKASIDTISTAFFEIYFLQLVCSLLAVLVYAVYSKLYCPYPKMSTIMIINVVSTIFDINWVFWGLERFKLTVTRNIIIKLSAVCAILLFVKSEDDIYLYALIMSVAGVISHISIWPFLKNSIEFRKIHFCNVIKHVKPCLVLFVPILAQYLYKNIDRVMLGEFSSLEQVGYYSNADKIAVMPIGIITALGTVLLPHLSNVVLNSGVEKAKNYIRISMKFSNFLSCGMMFGLSAISNELIPVFLGSKYLPCTDLLKCLSVLTFFVAWSNAISTQYLIPTHNDSVYVKGVCLGVAVNVICNYILIPKYGAFGAVIGTIVAEGLLMIYQNVKVKSILPINQYVKDCIPFFVCAAVMYFIVRLVSFVAVNNGIILVSEICTGFVVYVVLCLVVEIYRNPKHIFDLFRKLRSMK